MKTLLLLRHAQARNHESDSGDHGRSLTETGLRDARRVGEWLVAQQLVPDTVLSSDARRARETTEQIGQAGGFTACPLLLAELYLASTSTFFEVLRNLPDDSRRVLLVGHNPGLEDFVAVVSGQHLALPTTGLVEIELPVESWSQFTHGSLRQHWSP